MYFTSCVKIVLKLRTRKAKVFAREKKFFKYTAETSSRVVLKEEKLNFNSFNVMIYNKHIYEDKLTIYNRFKNTTIAPIKYLHPPKWYAYNIIKVVRGPRLIIQVTTWTHFILFFCFFLFFGICAHLLLNLSKGLHNLFIF